MAVCGTGGGRKSPRGAICAGSFWWGSLALVAALATACADGGAEPPQADALVTSPACPELPAPEPHETPMSPRGVYCTPSIVWEFGEGTVGLYHSTTGQHQRGWVVRDDDRLAVAWMVACNGGELGDGVAVCEDVDSWPLVTTENSITVGGVTAVGEWAGGCDQ